MENLNQSPKLAITHQSHHLTVAIIHGWAEGEWQSRQFRQQLHEAGYQLSNDVRQADVIFAHSSGCYLVPVEAKAKVIILVGIPYWPKRWLLTSVITKFINEVTIYRQKRRLDWWINKTIHNVWYIVTRPQASLDVITKHNLTNLPEGSRHKVLVVRPTGDTFTHPDIKQLLSSHAFSFITIPGTHDDCWLEPLEYIQLIQSATRK